jgi:flagellum-specific peptidoglycan hydrolase FlgJ
MNEHHVPASVILAVAMHESASGTSKVARYLNNHFGLKGQNNSTQIKSSYKGFDTVEESYKYFIGLLHTHPKFRNLFDKFTEYDYKNWARGMQRGGYAASSAWSSQIIGLIKKYNLQEFDNRPEGYIEPIAPVTVYKIYKVKKGDTLGAIAKKHHTSIKNLMLKNHLKNSDLKIGQKLKIQ